MPRASLRAMRRKSELRSGIRRATCR
jgi:hypothetical protein